MKLDFVGFIGDQAVKYFETSFPEVHAYGGEGAFQNPAEWIVDLTTRVRTSIPEI